MSYNFTATAPKAELAQAVRVAGQESVDVQEDAVKPAVQDHVDAAAWAAAQMATVMQPGDEDAVRVNVSGHANPDHAPREGHANEFLTVTVFTAPEVPAQ